MATPEAILKRHADRPIVQRIGRRSEHQVTSQARATRWHASMTAMTRAHHLVRASSVHPAAARPPVAATLKRLEALQRRVAPQR